ncbi:class I SAM-dependent methyltransferase [Aliidiomarina taiwanensis]|uniref:class I SAM-dependent methyltransferase n=1 Tax=Aliidiomarina taiwanensis TaxID=946228 RepID=UPI003B8373C9
MHHDQSLTALSDSLSRTQRIARNLLFRVLSQMRYGYLTMAEEGEVVGCFGNPASSIKARIDVHDAKTYTRFLIQGDIGAGEAFMQQAWSSPDVTSVIRVFAMNLIILDKIQRRFAWLSWPVHMLRHLRRNNSKQQAKQNITEHYDLGNELYSRFLDARMQYSSAVYPHAGASLQEAQEHKLHKICNLLELTEHDHLVEIGTGWAGLAIFAATHYGCRVTTTTISEEQYAYAQQQVAEFGLENKITLLKQDYRDLTGQFDKLVSIEMIEAVGAKYLPQFFQKCSQLLKPSGRMVLQSITIADQRMASYNRNVDFIQRYVFPGGYLPSVELLAQMFRKHTDMGVRQLDDIGLHYADTLKDWRHGFNERKHELTAFGYDEAFARFWNYYLSYCEGAFRERTVSTVQLMATKPLCKH